jgi:hypothetical protein
VAPNRSFRVRLRCRRGCGGFVSLRRHGATLVEKRFEHVAGSFSVRLRLTKSLMGELRRRGSLSARIATST